MTKSYVVMREEFTVFSRYHNIKRSLKYFKVIIISLFLVAFIASAIATYTEYNVREEYAMRDLSIAMQVAPVWINSKIGATMTWEEILNDANRLTAEWVKDGRKNPNHHFLYKPQ